jgi:hypothetical protein
MSDITNVTVQTVAQTVSITEARTPLVVQTSLNSLDVVEQPSNVVAVNPLVSRVEIAALGVQGPPGDAMIWTGINGW